MLLTKYDLHASFFSPRKEGAQATSDKQRATDFKECTSVDHIIPSSSRKEQTPNKEAGPEKEVSDNTELTNKET